MREHHIGVVVESVEASGKIFSCLGYNVCSEVTIDKYQHNKIVFMKNKETLQTIELIEALDEQSTIKNFKPGIHHICYEVDEADAFREVFRKLGIGKIFSDELIAPAINNRHVLFACLKNGLFVEFLLGERKNEKDMCTDCGDN